jgi:hypothetical protein
MPTVNHSPSQPQASITKRMLVGAAIGLLVISLFLLSAGEGIPAWGSYWRIRPLIIVPFAGAMGGLFNYLIVRFHSSFGVNKTLALLISALVFIAGLWIGIVLGLDGTLWN